MSTLPLPQVYGEDLFLTCQVCRLQTNCFTMFSPRSCLLETTVQPPKLRTFLFCTHVTTRVHTRGAQRHFDDAKVADKRGCQKQPRINTSIRETYHTEIVTLKCDIDKTPALCISNVHIVSSVSMCMVSPLNYTEVLLGASESPGNYILGCTSATPMHFPKTQAWAARPRFPYLTRSHDFPSLQSVKLFS